MRGTIDRLKALPPEPARITYRSRVHVIASAVWNPSGGQGLRQLAELGLALVLSTLIGLERAVQQKSAGLRTHTLVGVGAALFMEVSQHGFNNVLGMQHVALDPSRVAAQIVSSPADQTTRSRHLRANASSPYLSISGFELRPSSRSTPTSTQSP